MVHTEQRSRKGGKELKDNEVLEVRGILCAMRCVCVWWWKRLNKKNSKMLRVFSIESTYIFSIEANTW